MNRVTSSLFLLGAGLALLPVAANAAQRRHSAAAPLVTAPPLTVRPRSFLDPGVNAPVGSGPPQYVWVIDRPRNDLSDEGGQAWRYGGQTLPGPFTAPGRPEPIADF